MNKLLREGEGVDPRFDRFSDEQRDLINRLHTGLTTKNVLVQSLYSQLPKGYALYSYDKLNTAGTRLSKEDMAEAKLINVYPSLYQNISQTEEELAAPMYPKRSWSRLFNRSMLIKSLLEELYRTCKPSGVEIRGLTIFNPTYRRKRDYADTDAKDVPLTKNAVSTAWKNVKSSMKKLKRLMQNWKLTDPNRIVPSYLIVAATYLREHYPTAKDVVSDEANNKLKAWMIRSQLWRHHTGGSTQQKLDDDCDAARSGNWQSMYKVAKEQRRRDDVKVTLEDVGLPLIPGNGSPTDGQFILELIRHLAVNRGARDLDNIPINENTLYTKDHIFPNG